MRVPAVFMRGGTSKALFFHEADLPEDPRVRDQFILAAYGSPDPFRRQIDGVGGAASSTSKVAVISDGREQGVDVLYEFGQVGIDQRIIDRRGNCGNISSAVGPFAVDEGLVEATDPMTVVRFLNVNTGKVIVAHVPTKGGRFDPNGEFELPGVPGRGSAVKLDYLEPGGSVTGRLLPTGNAVDQLDVPGLGTIDVSLVDAANPLVFVRWRDVGLDGTETAAQLDADQEFRARAEAIRAQASVLAGIAPSAAEATAQAPSVPKLSFVGPPRDYTAANGHSYSAEQMSVRAAMMSMGWLHPSYPLTGAIATSVASRITGTLVNEAIRSDSDSVVIGHQSGLLPMEVDVEFGDTGWFARSASGFRTARRLFEGAVLVPDERLDQSMV
ncbi:2-methylaconitate cis-trans isomerase PrpF family protein [Paramicrobacterium agarici]|uniref:2-methylaconitate cis-trans isomerase n=1 Tax=Paramicrobacterium agarici TaxID=630514 RepID=A0A2A9DV43_9MICO|nr:PrpF domain-containing protein [Microbacterium agarici]PFG29820.1 hypothetical protein ATJ78_0735 [Microbacterium agarici]